MPDPFFSTKSGKPEIKEPVAESRVTAIIEILEFSDLTREENIRYLNNYYHELSREVYTTRRQNYCLGLRVLEPQLQIFSDRIILSSPLFLEKEVPELSAIAFKLFIDFCNMVLAVALKNEIALKGIGNTGTNYRGVAYSGDMSRAKARESMVLSDILEVFTFEEVFPEGFGQKILPPVSIPYFFGKDLIDSASGLSSINDIGIFFPLEILQNPFAEIAVYSEMLTEKQVGDKHMFSCNWKDWIEKRSDDYSLKEILVSLEEISDSETEIVDLWKRLLL